MKRILKVLNEQLDDFSKPISNTLDIIVICIVAAIIRFILTGTTILNDLHDSVNVVILTSFSFISSYHIYENEKFDEKYSAKDLFARLIRAIVYAYIVFSVIFW
ncbi:MAG: hypothetical protein IKE01_01300 [Clostridia bacterium]|nr:hypothetical protein [Clostridia bacterium]